MDFYGTEVLPLLVLLHVATPGMLPLLPIDEAPLFRPFLGGEANSATRSRSCSSCSRSCSGNIDDAIDNLEDRRTEAFDSKFKDRRARACVLVLPLFLFLSLLFPIPSYAVKRVLPEAMPPHPPLPPPLHAPTSPCPSRSFIHDVARLRLHPSMSRVLAD